MYNIKELELKRREYANVKWKSANSVKVRITEIDDSHLINIMRSVSKSLTLAEHFPLVKEFQEYEGILYSQWVMYLQNEYTYRETVVENRYNEFVEKEIYRQSTNDYYSNR
jgi:hypothetical protein